MPEKYLHEPAPLNQPAAVETPIAGSIGRIEVATGLLIIGEKHFGFRYVGVAAPAIPSARISNLECECEMAPTEREQSAKVPMRLPRVTLFCC
jgi:hypothetical protein